MKKIALISHGCAKNLVDSELILGILAQNGYKITLNENETDTVIVNTCSFICDAEKESVRSILEMVDAGKNVIVTGCLAQKHAKELKEAIEKKIKEKQDNLVGNMASQGTTPRQITDLIGSLCDLTSGSGDKGTPVVLVQGYFDNYTND